MLGQQKAAQRVAIIVVGTILAASGCRTNREVTRPEPVDVTEKRLTEALLTAEDVPSSYAVAEEGTPIDTDIIPEHECDDALGKLEPKEAVTIDFTGTGLGTRLTNSIGWFPGRGAAVGDVYSDLLEDCEEVVVTDDGLSFTTKTLNFGVLSDDTLPLEFLLESEDGSIELRHLIIMRTGDLVNVIRLTGPRPVDKELLDAVVRVAIGNLGLLDEQT